MTYIAKGTCGFSSSQRAAAICGKMPAHLIRSSLSHGSGESVGANSKLTTTVSTPRFIGGTWR